MKQLNRTEFLKERGLFGTTEGALFLEYLRSSSLPHGFKISHDLSVWNEQLAQFRAATAVDDFEASPEELRAARVQWSKLSCQGKADADAFFGDSLADVATSPCGLKHTGCCNPGGEPFYIESEGASRA